MSAGAQTGPGALTTIFNFDTAPVQLPKTGVVIGANGVLYGTAGFPPGFAVYSLTPPAGVGGNWTYATLYQTTGPDLSQPVLDAPGLAIDANGVIYGVSNHVVNSACTSPACEYVFALTPPASPGGSWTETTLHSFTGGSNGSAPASGVTIGKGGVLYGTYGGAAIGTGGAVYSLTPPVSPGATWTLTTLHYFPLGVDTASASPLAIDSDGVLYGTTSETVFSLTPTISPGGGWAVTVIHDFGPEGATLDGGVLMGTGSAGQLVLYGAARGGASGGGLVYSLSALPASPGQWKESVLYEFPTSYHFTPGPLVWGPNGGLYGVTPGGGAQHWGSVYALLPPASHGLSWRFRNLYSFAAGSGATGGNDPWLGQVLAVGSNGLIYGTTFSGGPFNSGTVFSIDPQ